MNEIIWTSVARAATATRLINVVKNFASLTLSILLKKSILWGAPSVLHIEPSVCCNLSCPQCLAGLKKIQRNESFISLELYKKIIAEAGDKIWYLLLYNQGEPFLHDNLLEMIQIARRRRIYVITSTNGHFFNDSEFVENFIVSGINAVIISLDGADAETYRHYRKGGNFEMVHAGVKRLVECRKRLGLAYPKIMLQFLVTRKNEHQLGSMKRLAACLKVDRLLIKSIQIEQPQTADEYLPSNPGWRRYDFFEDRIALKNQNHFCHRLWYSAVVLSDGRVVPCCFDKNSVFTLGNAKQSSPSSIWKSSAAMKFRNMIIQNGATLDICRNCTENQKTFLKAGISPFA